MSVGLIIRGITRETFKNRHVAKLTRKRDGINTSIATKDQLLESRPLAVADDADVSDFWMFGQVSLFQNPIIDFSQCTIASIYGYRGAGFIVTPRDDDIGLKRGLAFVANRA